MFGGAPAPLPSTRAAPESQFIRKPANLTFEQAAAVGVSATTALQLLRDDGKVQPGQKVLVNGASGGVGSFAVQIAKAFGAEVTGVTSTKNVDLVRSIGADHVIDYTREDFTAVGPRYDLIFDNVGNHSMARTRRALTPTGTLISNGGGHAGGKLARTLRAMLVSIVVRQQARPDGQDPEPRRPGRPQGPRRGRADDPGDRHAPIRWRTAEAIASCRHGHARGTIVITVAQGPSIAAPASLNTLKVAVGTA